MRLLSYLVTTLVFAAATSAKAQTYNTLFSFNGTDGDGLAYMSLTQGIDGQLYGTTAGFNGAVFKMIQRKQQ